MRNERLTIDHFESEQQDQRGGSPRIPEATKQKAYGELQKITRPAFDCKEKEKGSALKRNNE